VNGKLPSEGETYRHLERLNGKLRETILAKKKYNGMRTKNYLKSIHALQNKQSGM
jgi:hypothetical protein